MAGNSKRITGLCPNCDGEMNVKKNSVRKVKVCPHCGFKVMADWLKPVAPEKALVA